MSVKVFSAALQGIDAQIIAVETDIANGLYCFNIVGLPDKSVEESKDRVNAALKNAGFHYPKESNQKIIVNLAPAHIKKEGSGYDLPIAMSYLLASAQASFDPARTLFAGELALDGKVRPIRGMLSVVAEAKRAGFRAVLFPADNAAEAELISDITLVPVAHINECVDYCAKGIVPQRPEAAKQIKRDAAKARDAGYAHDFSYIKGQEHAKRALEIAAAGGHNVLMSGPPGAGKTMLARAFASILPDMTEEEIITTTKIHSVAGQLREKEAILSRPFRAPHHSASSAALIGGGARAKLGEITLAHNGVLFLDEFPEFRRDVIEALRQPLEERVITVSRAHDSFSYPARFTLIATKNPCPCGWYQSAHRECTCSLASVLRYQKKMSGPIADRIDMHLTIPAVTSEELFDTTAKESESEAMRARVNSARKIQTERFARDPLTLNSEMSPRYIQKYCPLDNASLALLKEVLEKLRLSARAFHKIIKLARTIADLAAQERIATHHIAEAAQYQARG